MFHWQNGWFFWRNDNGSVSFEHRVYGTEKNDLGELMYTIDAKENVPAPEWASIVASVSAGDEVGGRWQQALDFHNSTEEPWSIQK